MFSIFINYGASCASDYYRAFLPYIHCKDDLLKEDIQLNIGKVFEEKHDAYYLQRFINPSFYPYFLSLIKRGRRIAWDLDDNMWNIPEWSTAKFDKHQLQGLAYCIETADIVSASTEHLKNILLKYNDNVHVTSNLVDVDTYKNYKGNLEVNKSNGFYKALWAGSPTHQEDLEIVYPVIDSMQSLKDIHFYFLGYMPEKFDQLKNCSFIGGGCPTKYYPSLIKSIGPHIGIAPLCDHEFNLSKSNIKYLEMAMCGALPICSDFGPYKDSNGLRISIYENSLWKQAIYDVCNESFEREYKTIECQKHVIKEYSWDSHRKNEWISFFRKIAHGCNIAQAPQGLEKTEGLRI